MATLKEDFKKVLINTIKKEDIKRYNKIYKDYKSDVKIKCLFDSFFKNIHPFPILDKMFEEHVIGYELYHKINHKLYKVMCKHDINKYRFKLEPILKCVFVAKTTKEKMKLYNFCKKNGINTYYYLRFNTDTFSYIREYSRFRIYDNCFIESFPGANETISLNKYIYNYEVFANKLNGTELSLKDKIKLFFKLKFNRYV